MRRGLRLVAAVAPLLALASCGAPPDDVPPAAEGGPRTANTDARPSRLAAATPAKQVSALRIPGPVQFILGDPVLGAPRRLPLEGYGRDGRRVVGLQGTVGVRESEIAALDGLIMTPRRPGATVAWAAVAGAGAGVGVHVYDRFASLAALDTAARIPPARRLLAMPWRLLPGEFLRQALPPGAWMLAMLPEVDLASGVPRLRVEGARCSRVLTPRRFVCDAGAGASIVVYRPLTDKDQNLPEADGMLLARWLATR